MNKPDLNRTITGDELVAAVAAMAILFVPLFLLVVFPENRTVSTLFGNGRFLVFWALIFGLAYVFRKTIDRIGADWARKRKENSN